MRKKTGITESEQLCQAIVEGMQDNKAKDISVLDLRHLPSAVCDFFVICSGESNTHVDGISNAVTRFTRKELKEKPWHIEGKTNRASLVDEPRLKMIRNKTLRATTIAASLM